MIGQHFLVVPDDPDQPLEIDHPPSCPQHGQLTSVRHPLDNSYLCPFERAQWETGLETFFGRDDPQVVLFVAAAEAVHPGRHPIECTTAGLRLVVLLTDATNLDGWTLAKYTRVNAGTLYVWLDRLERAGLISGEWEEPADDDDRPRRRFYRLTPDGWLWAWDVLGLQPPDSRRR